jgi:hypothetical protein
MALSGCSNLIDLQLREVELAPPEVNQVVLRCKIPTPVSLYIDQRNCGLTTVTLLSSTNLHTDGPIVDFSRLQRAEFDVESRSDFGQVIELIKVTTQLEHFSIYTRMSSDVMITSIGWTELPTGMLLTDRMFLQSRNRDPENHHISTCS